MRLETHTFAAGESIELQGGNYFLYVEGDDPIDVDFWRGNRRLERESAQGAKPTYQAEPPREPSRPGAGDVFGFTAVTITSPTAQTVTVGISDGEGGYNRGATNAEITSPLGPNGGVGAEDPGSGDSFAEILAMMKNAVDQRAAMTTLEGATFYSANNTTTVIASAVANVNGVIIRQARHIASSGGTVRTLLKIDGNSMMIGSGLDTHEAVENWYIPAGVEVALVSTDGSVTGHAWVEIL